MPKGSVLVAVVLSAGLAIAICTLAVGAVVHAGPISQEESNLLSTVLGAIVGAVATYLGTRRPDQEDKP